MLVAISFLVAVTILGVGYLAGRSHATRRPVSMLLLVAGTLLTIGVYHLGGMAVVQAGQVVAEVCNSK